MGIVTGGETTSGYLRSGTVYERIKGRKQYLRERVDLPAKGQSAV